MAIDSNGNIANPLDFFQSYSFHHILMVASNTEDFYKIQQASADGTFQTSQFENLSLDAPIPGTKSSKSSGVFVISDTRKNSNFSIKNVNYECTLNGPTQITAPVINGKISLELHDFYGITFLNYLQYLLDTQLKCNYDGAIWVLKTIFVGHTADAKTEVVQVTELPMKLQGIQSEFRDDGGHYSIQFVQTNLGAPGVTPKAALIGQSSTHLKSDPNRTLQSVVQDFQNHLNQELKDYYDKLRVTQLPASQASDDQGSTTEQTQVGRLVQYMFTIPDEWKDWTVDGVAEARKETDWGNKGTQQKENTAVGAVTIDLRPDMTIEAGLEEIFKHCDQLLKRAKVDPKKSEPVKFWKIVSSITSDERTVCLHWDIFDHEVTEVATDKDGKPKKAENFNKGSDGISRPKNSLEFDYMYSGKNNDILKFDMKFANAEMLLATTVNRDPSSNVKNEQKNNTPSKDTAAKPNVSYIRENTPIFLPDKTGDQLKGFSYIAPGSTQTPEARQQYLNSLAKYYAQSSISAKLTIRGNPNLLNMTTTPIAPHVPGVLASDSKNNAQNVSAQTAYRNYLQTIRENKRLAGTPFAKELANAPLMAKINVFAPNVKELNFDGTGGNDFAKKFWYEGYYKVWKVSNHFSADGIFTQDLDLLAMELTEAPNTVKAEDKK